MKIIEQCILFCFGAVFYGLIEVVWRGYTHWSMLIAGGVCFLIVGLINRHIGDRVRFPILCVISGTAITAVEFAAGVIVNLWLGFDVWDYSGLPLNILGQVSFPFWVMWILLSAFALYAERFVRFWMFGDIRYMKRPEKETSADNI